jgi:FkbM family methyltransferase
MNFNSQIWSYKLLILKLLARIFEKLQVSSVSAGQMGTFDGEEFIFIDEYIRNFPQTTINVLDIGANVGDWALKFLSVEKAIGLKQSNLLCVEPIPLFYDILKSRTESHDNITCQNLAIADVGGVLQIAEIGGGGTAFVDGNRTNRKLVTWHSIKSITGDDFLVKNRFKPDYIKIDTDGYDFSVMKSLVGYITDTTPWIQFEFTHRFAEKAGYTLKEVIQWLASLEYQVYVIDKYGDLQKVRIPRLEVLNHQTKNFIAIPKLGLYYKR